MLVEHLADKEKFYVGIIAIHATKVGALCRVGKDKLLKKTDNECRFFKGLIFWQLANMAHVSIILVAKLQILMIRYVLI